MNGFHDYEVKLELAIWYWNKPSLINKHSGKATHDLTNHLKARNISVKKLVCWSAIIKLA